MTSNLREFNQKLALLEQLQEEIESFKNNPEFQADLNFRDEVKAIQKKYEKTDQDVIDIMNPAAIPKGAGYSQLGRAKGGGRGRGQRAHTTKVYRNPHTGEEVTAKNLLNKRLQEWCASHGKETVREWVVQEVPGG